MSELKTYVVPLVHDTLTREEVAARCIAAAEKKGYKADENPEWSTLVGSDEKGIRADHFFANRGFEGYAFHNHDCQSTSPNTLTTLEAFEQYCRVTDNTLEQRLADLEEKIDRLADILAEKLQQPKEEVKTEKQVVIDGLFAFSGEITLLYLPDESRFWKPPQYKSWVKSESDFITDPHTLVTVEKHTVGKFYLYKDQDPSEFDSYALYLGDGEFASAYLANGIIGVSKYWNKHVTLQEVQPLNQ